MRKSLLVFGLALALAGCVSLPTSEQIYIATVNHYFGGEEPTEEEFKQLLSSYDNYRIGIGDDVYATYKAVSNVQYRVVIGNTIFYNRPTVDVRFTSESSRVQFKYGYTHTYDLTYSYLFGRYFNKFDRLVALGKDGFSVTLDTTTLPIYICALLMKDGLIDNKGWFNWIKENKNKGV